jgi:two-component system nitrogen regulation response regulator GlnG
LELWVSQLLDDTSNTTVLDTVMPRVERVMINAALRKSSGRKKDAAELLGWGRNTLTRKMQELDY